MCIFCKILDGEIPSNPVYEDENCIVIPDLHPQAPVHYLVIPRQHISSISAVQDSEWVIITHLLQVAQNIGQNFPGYKLQFNVNSAGGQEIMHIHLHLLAGFAE